MVASGSSIAFAVRGERRNGVVRLFPRGEIDMATAPLLEEALAIVEESRPAALILDFSGITFMDSTGLHALVRAHGRASQRGRVLAVVNGGENVQRLFELTRTGHLFEPAVLPEILGPMEDWSPISLPGVDGG